MSKIPLALLSIPFAAYLLGSIPFGLLLTKLFGSGDVRKSGSGNIGATNVLRTTGRAAGIVTLLLDIAKGAFAVWLAGKLTAADMRRLNYAVDAQHQDVATVVRAFCASHGL